MPLVPSVPNTRPITGSISVYGDLTIHGKRLLVENAQGEVISPFHDVPLWADEQKGLLNMVCEIPRNSNAKLEISKEEAMNPIKQDVKKGKIRFVKNLFPYHGYLWNYGAFPQTWESPLDIDAGTGCCGDNDPLDCIEIGGSIMASGSVHTVKVLGVLALLDEGETDWKVLVINTADPMAPLLNDLPDVKAHCPGLIEATRDWFRNYKIPDGKPANEFAFEGQVKDRAFALHVIQECNQSWRKLISGSIPAKAPEYDISIANRSVLGSPGLLHGTDLPMPSKDAALPDAPIDASVDHWAFVPRI